MLNLYNKIKKMDSLSIYVKELKNNHSTKEETLELIERARCGDKEARDQVIKNYLRLVFSIAKPYMGKGVPSADLISEGNVGLLTALEKYDPSKGFFSTCARLYIKQAIIRNCMHKTKIVRLPENVSELMRQGRWKGDYYGEVSIDMPNEEGDTLAETIQDCTPFGAFSYEEDLICKKKVEKLLSCLRSRDREIVKSVYGIGMEPVEIEELAESFGLTSTRINQIVRTSLKRMKIHQEDQSATKPLDIEIVSAYYGIEDSIVDVTDKVVDLYLRRETVKSSNRLGGDPCPGVKKYLVIQYICGKELLKKSFSEGSVVKF